MMRVPSSVPRTCILRPHCLPGWVAARAANRVCETQSTTLLNTHQVTSTVKQQYKRSKNDVVNISKSVITQNLNIISLDRIHNNFLGRNPCLSLRVLKQEKLMIWYWWPPCRPSGCGPPPGEAGTCPPGSQAPSCIPTHSKACEQETYININTQLHIIGYSIRVAGAGAAQRQGFWMEPKPEPFFCPAPAPTLHTGTVKHVIFTGI